MSRPLSIQTWEKTLRKFLLLAPLAALLAMPIVSAPTTADAQTTTVTKRVGPRGVKTTVRTRGPGMGRRVTVRRTMTPRGMRVTRKVTRTNRFGDRVTRRTTRVVR